MSFYSSVTVSLEEAKQSRCGSTTPPQCSGEYRLIDPLRVRPPPRDLHRWLDGVRLRKQRYKIYDLLCPIFFKPYEPFKVNGR